MHVIFVLYYLLHNSCEFKLKYEIRYSCSKRVLLCAVQYHLPATLHESHARRIRPTATARLKCDVGVQFHAQLDVQIFITRFFQKNGKKGSVKFWDPWLHRVISDSCSNDSCYNG